MIRGFCCVHNEYTNLDACMYLKDIRNASKKIPKVTNEGCYSQKQLSGPVEQKNKEKTLVSSSKALTRFSSL